MKHYKFIPLLLVLVLLLVVTGCGTKEVEVTRVVTEKETVTVVETVVETETVIETVVETVVETETVIETVIETVEVEPAVAVPFEELWAGSAHNAVDTEAFRHWDEDDPAEVPPACARCHSTPGYLDYIGADGTEAWVTDNPAPIGTTVECEACHNDVTLNMTSVIMPSGIELTGLGDESRCMQCHQGRESTVSVNAAIEEAGVDDDEISEDLGFRNIHYYAAGATKYGTEAKGGYEYDGKSYDAFFVHVDGYEACIDCHNPHTLELKIDECTACHSGVSSAEDFKDVRMPASQVDYDSDGDISEGVYYEIVGLQEKLYAALQAYADEVVGTPIMYDSQSYPYFFTEDGERYATWTPRLLKAAYNYQVSQKDPGAFAHGGKYIIQLLWDSIEDLNTMISSPVEMLDTHGHLHRIDHGHFAGSEEAFRHWDEDPAVPASCSRCHSDAGLPLYLTEGVTIAQPQANGFRCSTCHNDLAEWTRYEATSVTFPSGAEVDSGDPNMNLCMTCHQGRSSTPTVDARLADLPDDEVSDAISFINVHYFPAGATIFGTEAKGAYEYPDKEYLGRFEHVPNINTCTACHNAHQLTIKAETCSGCHPSVTSQADVDTIRIDPTDWDGDGDTDEGIAGEVAHMRDALYVALQDYAANNADTASIVYDAHSYPYFFDEEGERYATWTPSLLRGAYNYQYANKDPGAFAHNGKYVMQILYDSIEDLGGDVSGLTRP